MKRINLLMGLMLSCSIVSFGTSVPVNTAKNAGYNFLAQHDVALAGAGDLQLVYTSAQNNTDFYVFGNSNCFVIVAADDAAEPVLAYSLSNGFRAGHMPGNLSGMLNDYNFQMEYIISNNVAATAEITTQWSNLAHNVKTTAAKTTTAVSPLLTTTWDQGEFYDALCPADVAATSSAGHDVTGCVATAMSQVMKFWNWPVKGLSSSSYTSSTDGYDLAATYSATTYHWNLMPNNVSSTNAAVATLMSDAGISVDMDYTSDESGAFVTEMSVPSGTPCAELALKTYFNYKSTLHGIKRSNTTTSATSLSATAWTDSIEADIALGHPVLVDGQGTDGGHNFVFDGFDATNKFHVNWGWSGESNGYFAVNALNPSALGIGGGSGGGFNSSNHAIIGIVPNGTPAAMPLPDIYESDNSAATAYNLPVSWTSGVGKAGTPGSNFHITTDIDYYKIIIPAGHKYNVTVRVNDVYSHADTVSTYTGDAMWAYSTNGGTSWSATYDSSMTAPIALTSLTGDTVMFRVVQHISGTTGSYMLSISKIDPVYPTSINTPALEAARVFPNPATEVVTIDLSGTAATALSAQLTDVSGRVVYKTALNNEAQVTIPVQSYAPGIYILNVATTEGVVSREVSVK